MTEEDVRTTVINNALDFFRRSTEELEASPKYSLINFCAAVELFVKARLMAEHWTLVVAPREEANWDKFVKGEFRSVHLKDAQIRLRDVAHDALTKEEYDCFVALASHRNQLVHFRHREQDDIAKFREKIAGEQLRAWFYLQRLLRRRWQKHFRTIGSNIQQMEHSMRRRREYLEAKFVAIQSELEEERKKGVEFATCPFCEFPAFFVMDGFGELTRFGCRMCDSYGPQLEIKCPECNEPVFCRYEGFAVCERCPREIEPSDIVEYFRDEHKEYLALKGDIDEAVTANCAYCGTSHAVLPWGEKYLCVSCFELTDQCWRCKWCDEWVNEETGPTPIEGCSACRSAREEWMENQ